MRTAWWVAWSCAAVPAVAAAQRDRPATAPALERGLLGVAAPAVRGHLRFLADDFLEGRAPGTRGGDLAARYVAAQFETAGLKPAGPDGSYYQHVALLGLTPRPSLVMGANRQVNALTYLEDFVAWPTVADSALIVDGEIVFVGYGIQAPEWNWDDYKGEPLAGKILLMLVNDPGLHDSTVFGGRALTYYGRWTYKLEQAARLGAAGAILIHTDESATYPWSVVRNSWSGEQVALEARPPQTLRFGAWITADAARRTLHTAGRDLDLLVRRAQMRGFRPIGVGVHAVVDIRSGLRRFRSANVVARIDGSDPAGRGEAVVVTAHYDHLGIGQPARGDSIYNGAEDNASGVAALLAAAQALSPLPPPRRSLVFVATTAEEAGLLGAEAYVAAPAVPLERTAAVINIDGANLRGRTRDIVALGADRSTLAEPAAAAAQAESLALVRDPRPETGGFFRSDHFPFARAGIPVLSIRAGTDFVGRPAAWGREQADAYTRERYHQPGDEFRDDFSYDGALQQIRFMIRVALAVAERSDFPSWSPESEFRSAGELLRRRRGGN